MSSCIASRGLDDADLHQVEVAGATEIPVELHVLVRARNVAADLRSSQTARDTERNVVAYVTFVTPGNASRLLAQALRETSASLASNPAAEG
jgi:hypothetical protein